MEGWPAVAFTLTNEVGAIVLGMGYAGGVAWAVHAGAFPWLAAKLACVGRLALTNYLGQSVLMNGLFYWYGLRLSGELQQGAVMLLVGVLFALQIVLSALWLRHLRIGPAEWLWRRLSYGRRPAWR